MAGLPHFTLPLPAAAFLADYWQKKPLFMPAAATGLEYPDADTLASLAMDDAVESRIISGAGNGPWLSRPGPFDESVYPELGERDWTLLVQSVDHTLTETSLLLDCFYFIPGWRLEDIMISYAAEGGSVGPHFDRYDVFLIQAAGQRRWQLGGRCDELTPLQDTDQLKLVAQMQVEQEYLAQPGDVLYLPPGVAHHGVAEDSDCITWSVGFRAPDYQALLAEIAGECLAAAPSNLFTDPQRQPCEQPQLLATEDRQQLIRGALDLLKPGLIEQALYRWLSTPRMDGLEFAIDDAHIAPCAEHACLVRHGSTRMLCDHNGVWLNGEHWPLTRQQQPLAALLARQRLFTAEQLAAVMQPEGKALLDEWIEHGYFAPLPGDHHGDSHR